jgi:hypothetical protein
MLARLVRVLAAVLSVAGCFGQIRVTPRDIALVKSKLQSANPYFKNVWSQVFTSRGLTFRAPAIVALDGEMNTPCGVFKPGNGFYCGADNDIYLDASFLAHLMLQTASQTKTDGDYAAIVVAAHEFGHVVATQLGIGRPGTFESEQIADCFAGAVTRQAKIDRLLDPGDLAEARFALLISGEIITGGFVQKMIVNAQPGAHGGPDDRINSFNRGYYVGASACTDKLGNPGMTAAGPVIHSDALTQMPAGRGKACAWSSGPAGLRLTSVASSGPCDLRFEDLPLLPLDFRIEVTASLESGTPDRGFGLYWGAADLLYFFVRANGNYEIGTMLAGATEMPFFSLQMPGIVAPGYKAVNRLAFDVHRGDLGTTTLGYVNGRYAALTNAAPHDPGFVGVFLEAPGMTVVFSNLRVSRLGE